MQCKYIQHRHLTIYYLKTGPTGHTHTHTQGPWTTWTFPPRAVFDETSEPGRDQPSVVELRPVPEMSSERPDATRARDDQRASGSDDQIMSATGSDQSLYDDKNDDQPDDHQGHDNDQDKSAPSPIARALIHPVSRGGEGGGGMSPPSLTGPFGHAESLDALSLAKTSGKSIDWPGGVVTSRRPPFSSWRGRIG